MFSELPIGTIEAVDWIRSWVDEDPDADAEVPIAPLNCVTGGGFPPFPEFFQGVPPFRPRYQQRRRRATRATTTKAPTPTIAPIGFFEDRGVVLVVVGCLAVVLCTARLAVADGF